MGVAASKHKSFANQERSIMRVATLYDIHENLPTLEAVLNEVYQADVNEVVVGGDVVPGPLIFLK